MTEKTSNMSAIQADHIVKRFGGTRALDGISFEVAKGELFGLIGPDGAGKSTLFRILATLLLPDQGSARVLGHDVVKDWRQVRSEVGYMPGRFALYPDLSVAENLDFFASIFGVDPADNYALIRPAYRQLEPFEDRRAAELSGGMKQKLALSCALVHHPKLLMLDEPTTGVDAVSRTEFWDMLDDLAETGITVLVATPYMDEAVRCDRVGLIQEGQFLQVAAPSEVADSFDKVLFAVHTSHPLEALKKLRQYEHAASVQPFGDAIHLATTDNTLTADEIERYLASRQVDDARVKSMRPTIEDQFMNLIQQHAHA